MNAEQIEWNVEKGRVISATMGEYSDRCYLGTFVALEAFDAHKELLEFCALANLAMTAHGFDSDAFVSALVGKGLLLEIEIPHDELKLGSYGMAGDCAFFKNADW